jgi:endogenous inhibitor of DNA gyrase (YacG/DUF329 family)
MMTSNAGGIQYFYGNLSLATKFMTVVKCPICGRETEFENNEFRPFCSERCKILDLGSWADESYALPAEAGELTEADWETIEKVLGDNQEDS